MFVLREGSENGVEVRKMALVGRWRCCNKSSRKLG